MTVTVDEDGHDNGHGHGHGHGKELQLIEYTFQIPRNLGLGVATMGHAECLETQLDQIETCLIDQSLTACLAASNGCTLDNLYASIASDVLEETATTTCCNKASKGAKQGCFNNVLAALKTKHGKALIPTAVRAALTSEIKEFSAAVKQTGECPSEE